MGKGARNRLKNAEENRLKKEQELQTAQKKKKRNFVLTIVAVVLVAAILVSSLVYAFYFANGQYLRQETAATSQTVSLDNAMMLFFFEQNYDSYKSYYGDYLEAFTGINPKKSLKGQPYDEDETWFEYFKGITETSVEELMTLSDAAAAQGFTLTEEQLATVERRANEADLSGLDGKLNREDYRRCLELVTRASLFRNQITDGYSYTPEEVDDYYEEHSKEFQSVDYRRYSVSFSEEESSTLPGQEEAESQANRLKAAASEEEFLSIVEELIKANTPDIEEEDLQSRLDATLSENQIYSEGSEVSEWLFEEGRQVGDTYLYHTEESTSYTVYFITRAPARDESETVNTRHILITAASAGSEAAAKQKAEDLLAQWESGDKTAESFGELALEYTEDSGSVYTGGLYENVTEGSMIEEYDEWLFDSSRKAGDTAVIKTDYGFHVVYFEGEGKPVWRGNVVDTLKNEAYSTDLEAMKSAYPVTFNEEKIANLPV